jgi:hypothetical protein
MSEIETISDRAPWLASAGVTIDVNGVATVTGATTLFSKKFVVRKMASISLFVQGAGTGAAAAGTSPATAWRVFAANDYDPTNPITRPGTFVDVTADFGAVGVSTPPGVKQFGGAFNGATPDRFATWACPYAAIQFQLPQQSGTETVSGQFFASEI